MLLSDEPEALADRERGNKDGGPLVGWVIAGSQHLEGASQVILRETIGECAEMTANHKKANGTGGCVAP
jgi:hypothetical protein